MTYDPNTGVTTERRPEVVLTPQERNYGGIALAVVLVVLAILFVVWLFGSGDGTTTTDLDNPVLTTAPGEGIAPAETPLPAETTVPAPATSAP